jgi:general secretion pathway protein N
VRAAHKDGSRRVQAVLMVLCLCLAVIIYEELDRPLLESSANASAARAGPSAAPPKPVASFSMPALRDYTEVTARPLFVQSRRPPPQASRGPPMQVSAFTLVGIIVSDHSSYALVEFGQPPKLTRIREGQDLAGWTVEEILPTKVVLRHSDIREDIKPKDRPPRTPQRTGAVPPSPPQPPAVPAQPPPAPPARAQRNG